MTAIQKLYIADAEVKFFFFDRPCYTKVFGDPTPPRVLSHEAHRIYVDGELVKDKTDDPIVRAMIEKWEHVEQIRLEEVAELQLLFALEAGKS